MNEEQPETDDADAGKDNVLSYIDGFFIISYDIRTVCLVKKRPDDGNV